MCRLIIDDGSGLGLIDCYDDLITDAIEIPPLEWSNLLEIVKSCGKVYYSQQNTSWNGYNYLSLLEAKAHVKLKEVVQKWFLLRRVTVWCQPFVSTANRRECYIGNATGL